MHYFEVAAKPVFTQPPFMQWRDTGFVVAASDPALLAEITADLNKPIAERRHVSGSLAPGNGGFNRVGDFWYSWHIAPNAWALAEISIELCDGRPFSDVEQDTAYWINTVGQFCPWSSYIKGEIPPPLAVKNPVAGGALRNLSLAPNPADDAATLTFSARGNAQANILLTDLLGKPVRAETIKTAPGGTTTHRFSTVDLPEGIYFAAVSVGEQRQTRRLVVRH